MRALAIVLLLAACARRVVVPRTPEALKCYRECKLISATCRAGPYVDDCWEDLRVCLLTCPGAYER